MDINIKDLSEEQRKDLQKQLEEYEEEEKTVGDLAIWDTYWFIRACGDISGPSWQNDYIDNDRRKLGNFFLTKEEARKESERRRVIGKVNKKIDELNDGWEPDWEDYDQTKYSICYCSDNKKFRETCTYSRKDSMHLNYFKSQDIAEQIIDEMKDELKIIFDVD